MVEKELGAGLKVMMSGGGGAVAGTWSLAVAILITMMININFLLLY